MGISWDVIGEVVYNIYLVGVYCIKKTPGGMKTHVYRIHSDLGLITNPVKSFFIDFPLELFRQVSTSSFQIITGMS